MWIEKKIGHTNSFDEGMGFGNSRNENAHAEPQMDITGTTGSDISRLTTIEEETESMLLREDQDGSLDMSNEQIDPVEMSDSDQEDV